MKILTNIKNIFKRKKNLTVYEIKIQGPIKDLSDGELYNLIKKIMDDKCPTEKDKNVLSAIPKSKQLH